MTLSSSIFAKGNNHLVVNQVFNESDWNCTATKTASTTLTGTDCRGMNISISVSATRSATAESCELAAALANMLATSAAHGGLQPYVAAAKACDIIHVTPDMLLPTPSLPDIVPALPSDDTNNSGGGLLLISNVDQG